MAKPLLDRLKDLRREHAAAECYHNTACDCGADEHNAALDAIVMEVEGMLALSPEERAALLRLLDDIFAAKQAARRPFDFDHLAVIRNRLKGAP